MGGRTTRNMQSSLQKYNKLYIVAFCWTIIDMEQFLLYIYMLLLYLYGQLFLLSHILCHREPNMFPLQKLPVASFRTAQRAVCLPYENHLHKCMYVCMSSVSHFCPILIL